MNYFKPLFLIFLILFAFSSCEDNADKTLFTKVTASSSGLEFNNQLTLNDSVNILDNEFVYNGAGVALGDLNGDDLDDIFFAANQVDNKLYLNTGNLTFDDISTQANIIKPEAMMWSSGVSIIDINNDNLLDIYVCNTFRKTTSQRANLLYINQGNDQKGIPTFKEMAKSYGVADTSYSSHAQFFDYDNDGDLDLFIGVNRIDGIDPSEFRPSEDDGTSKSRDILYENQQNDSITHPVFVDVSKKAGIRYHGYSHSTLIHDFNSDGWLDIYVANDFLSNDLVYINNQDGTFSNKAGEIFKHFSLSSMGSDIADIDNNGKMDLFTTEMQPYYNKRKKLFQGPSNYQKEILTRKYDYEYQYARNTLQLNRGTNTETELPIFSEIGMYAGVQETDWSWAPLFADFDNDSWQDLFITNGFPKDVTDRDFGDFRMTASRLVSKERLLAEIPEIKIPNFIFKNNGNSTYQDFTENWGLNFGTFSNGAAYGDLDQDGDLDLVVNNIDDKALLLENNSEKFSNKSHYLRIKLKGNKSNKAAIGAEVTLYHDNLIQQKSVLAGRGYLSQPEQVLHFGMGNTNEVDSIRIKWPDNKNQTLTTLAVDTLIVIDYNADLPNDNPKTSSKNQTRFDIAAGEYNLKHFSKDYDFIDFNFQSTLPHKFSQYGPAIAVGDINNDGLEDMFLSSSRGFKETWFIQKPSGAFSQSEVSYKKADNIEEEDSATLLFDLDNDGDLDLYIARGCAQYPEGHNFYKDVLLINDGNGNFSDSSDSLPEFSINSSTVKAADYDRDGDLDLFVGSRVKPFSYPIGERSYILRNESTKTNPKFVDVTAAVSNTLLEGQLICDAIWTDFNGDFWPDLIVASEWQPIRFFQNDKGSLIEITQTTGVEKQHGWWNSLSAADLDNDGDIDYVAGNMGNNTYFKGNEDEPVRIYAKDLDNNGSIDPLISYYLRDSVGIKKEYLYHPWQDVIKQYVGIRKKFNSFGEFGATTLPEMFSDGLLEDSKKMSLNYTKTSWIENLGNGKFKLHALPIETQLAPIYGILPQYLDDDNKLDLLMVGNDYGMEVQQGRADALMGVALKNQVKDGFKAFSMKESGFFVPGDAKGLVSLNLSDKEALLIATQNNDSLRVFKSESRLNKSIIVEKKEVKAMVKYADGTTNVQEFYWGTTFKSQSSRVVNYTKNATEIRFYDNLGNETRKIEL